MKNFNGHIRKEICITDESVLDFNKEIHNPSYFVRHVFCYLREHMELLEQPDYDRLYEETLNFQIRQAIKHSGWSKNDVKENREWIEFLADLNNKYGLENHMKFSKDQIDQYLEYRRSFWNGDI